MGKFLTVCLAIVLPFLSGCSQKDRYGDVRGYINEMADYQMEYAKKLSGAKSAEDVARAIDEYGDRMAGFAERGRKFRKKYPEIKEGNVPDELKADFDRLSGMADKMNAMTSPVFSKYLGEPEVLAAIQKLAKKLGGEKPLSTDERN